MFKLTRDRIGGVVLALSGYALCLAVIWSLNPEIAEGVFHVTASIGGFAALVGGITVAANEHDR